MPDAVISPVDPAVAQLQDWLRAHEQDLLNDTIKMLQIPSIEGDAEPNAPFGKENRRALDLALDMSAKAGMRTKDIEGFIGFGEFGEGDKMLMILGHLDVVPIGPGWKFEPFGAAIKDGYIYARGTTDDKGPTMAAFYAARAIQECFPDLGVRIRIAFGCNEESGFKCVHRYMETEEPPTLGVAPDSDWPCIHGEKGSTTIIIRVPLQGEEMKLLSVVGGQRPNIVMDRCTVKVQVAASARAEIEEKLADSWDKNVTFSWEGDTLTAVAIGKAAHAMFPFGGDSAGIRALRFLQEIAPLNDSRFYAELFRLTQINGAGIGIDGRDEPSGDLTCNFGIVETTNDAVELLFNNRYPVTWKIEDIMARCHRVIGASKFGFEVKSYSDSKPLYFPLEHPMVQTICKVYEQETGETRAPGVMGGGTYARAVPNTVSIGTHWIGDGRAHENDERYKIEHLFKASRIYAHMLYRLALVAKGM